jgi:hypothetical protein
MPRPDALGTVRQKRVQPIGVVPQEQERRMTGPSLLWETSPWVFLALTVIIGGGAAWMTGRGVALGWKPFSTATIYAVMLAMGVRFLHWSIFYGHPQGGGIFSVQYFLVDFFYLWAVVWLAYQVTRTTQMVTQYHWLYRRSSPISWREV